MPGLAKAPVFLISGTPGSGKTSVAATLMQHFPLGLHLPVDDFREFVVSGQASVFDWSEETDRQFALARTAAVGMATSYLEADFAVALDDVVFPAEAERVYAKPLPEICKVLLLPSLEAALQRNAERIHKSFDTAVLTGVIKTLHGKFTEQEQDFRAAGWRVIDSSKLTLAETVARIVDGADQPSP